MTSQTKFLTRENGTPVLSSLSEYVDGLGKAFVADRSQEQMREFILYGTLLSRTFRMMVNYKYVETEFDTEIALELLIMYMTNRVHGNILTKIEGLVDKRRTSRKSVYTLTGEEQRQFVEDNLYTAGEVEISSIMVEEILNEELGDMPTFMASQVLYYVSHPDEIKFLVNNFPESLEKYAVYFKVRKIRKRLVSDKSKHIDISIPNNRTSNALLMSGLYSKSSAAFALLSMFGDFKTFLEFISLFGGQTVKFPELQEIAEIFKSSSIVANKFEKNELTITDREHLVALSIEKPENNLDGDVKLNPFLSEFLQSLVSKTMEKYDLYLQKLMDQSASLKTEDQMAILSTLTREMKEQVRLLQEIFGTVSTIDKINLAISNMSDKRDKNLEEFHEVSSVSSGDASKPSSLGADKIVRQSAKRASDLGSQTGCTNLLNDLEGIDDV